MVAVRALVAAVWGWCALGAGMSVTGACLPLHTFLMRYGKYGVGNGSWPFPPRCASFVFVERSRVGRHLRKDFPGMAYQRSRRRCLRELIVRRDGGPAQGRRPYTQPSRQPTAGGNTQSKRPSSRP